MTIFNGIFGSAKDVFNEFMVNEKEQKGIEFIYAWYKYEYYSGDAFVLFTKDGKLYEVNGSHCSCHGLSEDCWSPEETSLEALKKRDHYAVDYDAVEVAIKRWKQREYARKYRLKD